MVKAKIQIVQFRRKRERKTNYKKRISFLTSGKPRIVIRKSVCNINIQVIEYKPEGDNVLASANSKELVKFGYSLNRGNIPAAYLTGLLLGQKAKKKAVKEAIVDAGLNIHVKGSRIYAALKGVVDSGLKVPCSEDIFPSEERISGAHISNYAEKLKKENMEMYEKQFSSYIKKNTEDVKKQFNDVKDKIMKV
ncbi:50S ribosomal protein L18 [Candidatus Woesearchaeota archaeon]|nr:50S ribosomal protein L18 [Candidatus Woesearchaeota archaeon]MBU3941967.1 50S ribosomal protein L18 [Nanoarchaeota archaeon]